MDTAVYGKESPYINLPFSFTLLFGDFSLLDKDSIFYWIGCSLKLCEHIFSTPLQCFKIKGMIVSQWITGLFWIVLPWIKFGSSQSCSLPESEVAFLLQSPVSHMLHQIVYATTVSSTWFLFFYFRISGITIVIVLVCGICRLPNTFFLSMYFLFHWALSFAICSTIIILSFALIPVFISALISFVSLFFGADSTTFSSTIFIFFFFTSLTVLSWLLLRIWSE